MRRENLPAGGHDKVIWKRGRDRSRDKVSRQRNSETWWKRATATLLGVSFGSFRRRHRDVLMGRRGYLPLRRLGDVPLRRRWVFHLRLIWDVVETYWWDVIIMSVVIMTHTNKTSWRHINQKFWRRSIESSCFIWDVDAMSLGRTKRRRCNIATTSCCRVGRC